MSAYVPAALKRLIRTRFGDRCAYCRSAEDLTATQFEIEHIRPRADGGETLYDNLCLACPMCNRFKSDSASAIDPVTNESAELFHPQRDLWIEHFRWSEDGTEVIGLTASGRATAEKLRMNRASMVRVRRMWVAMSEHPPQS